MKLKVEIGAQEDEIILRAVHLTDEISRLQQQILTLMGERAELTLYYGQQECYVPCEDILFFETAGGKVQAHTAEHMYDCSYRLYELEELLPRSFMRASKSCLANTAKVSGLTRSFTGGSEVSFRNCHKQVFISRMYDKAFREKIRETRLK